MRNVITIDGPAGSGKSTVSRSLARRLGLLYLDTGAMYRAVALAVQRRFGSRWPTAAELGRFSRELHLTFDDETDPPRLFLGREDVSRKIRTPEMDILSSDVSAIPDVRDAMVTLQRRIAAESGLVAEGRDMGTVVFPEALHKFFLTASAETRARRRYLERLERGEDIPYTVVLAQLEQRDRQDETRPVAPLRPAPDALVLDTGPMNADTVVETILRILKNNWKTRDLVK